ncbi:hypothetical protein D3C72_1964460 [compost metagenome]
MIGSSNEFGFALKFRATYPDSQDLSFFSLMTQLSDFIKNSFLSAAFIEVGTMITRSHLEARNCSCRILEPAINI